MTILLFGRRGQLGTELSRSLLPLDTIIAVGRNEIDLQDVSALVSFLEVKAPQLIINAAAYTAVDKAEVNESAAYQVNAAAVGAMARYAQQHAALLIHYSTDFVFDGDKISAYRESDPTNPLNAYGRTKLAGEQAVLASGCEAIIFRTSWVFSSHGTNFIKTILRLARERETLNIVADQYGAPTSAELIADVTAQAVSGWRRHALTPGIYHLTAAGETSWHSLACHVIREAKLKGVPLKVDPAQVRPIAAADYPSPARRPLNSRLDTNAISIALGLRLPDYRIHVDRAIDQLISMGNF